MKRILCVLIAIMLLVGAALAEAGQAIDPEAQSLGLEGVGNARELGGYTAADGKTVKRGVLLRTAKLSDATEADVERLMFARTNVVALCHECHASYHKEQRYHSTEKVKERQQQRQEAWIDQMKSRFKGG